MNTAQNPQAALLDYPTSQLYLGGISRSTLKLLVAKGELRGVSIGRRRFIALAELDRYITSQLVEAASAK